MLVAHPSVPANNLQELIALAKSKPESLVFGSSGYATASYMAAASKTEVGEWVEGTATDVLADRMKLIADLLQVATTTNNQE